MSLVRANLTGLNKKWLAIWLSAFFLVLITLAGILVQYSYSQLKWETFNRYRLLSQELVNRVDDRFSRLIKNEETRSFVDYAFLNVAGDPSAGFIQRSPLAQFPLDAAIPGLIGYFQVDTEGVYSTPLLPDQNGQEISYGIPQSELNLRKELAARIRRILNENQLVAEDKPRASGTLMPIAVEKSILQRQAPEEAETKSRARDDDRFFDKSFAQNGGVLYEVDLDEAVLDEGVLDEVDLDEEVLDAVAQTGVALTNDTQSRTTPTKIASLEANLALMKGNGRTYNELTGDTQSELRRIPQKKQAQAQAAFDNLKAVSKTKKDLTKLKTSQASQSSGKTKYKFQVAPTKVEELDLGYTYQPAAAEPAVPELEIEDSALSDQRYIRQKNRGARLEKNVLPEFLRAARQDSKSDTPVSESSDDYAAEPDIRITTFQSEIDPFEFSLLESGHFVLFRKVWKEGQRYIQGMLLERDTFLSGVIEPLLEESAIAKTSDLIVVYQGNVFTIFRGGTSQSGSYETSELKGELLLRARFSAPMGDLELMSLVNQLPVGPGGTLIIWVAVLLTVVLLGGFTLMYWLGVKQIDLTRQQQDFVSAVSHELNTPLTSIRMYGEMLRDGWAPEEKVKTYYDFICDESERLTRLISNVLQLARMTRNELEVELKEVTVCELADLIRSKISSQIERSGFKLNLTWEEAAANAALMVDTDYFNQIVINLVDNAIKFSGRSEKKQIDISFNLRPDNRIIFRIRDYGPGVSGNQMKKIFRLFYRSEDKFIRETRGTGIGLSLVNQLATSMSATVDVVNANPGAEFRILF